MEGLSMDTTGFAFFQPGIDQWVDQWLSKNANIHEKQKRKPQDFERRKPMGWLRDYKTVTAYKFEGKDVFVGRDRKHDVPTLAVLRFEVHLSQFTSFNYFLEWAKKIFREAFPCLIDAKIFRLDLPVDIASSLDFYFRHLHQPRARNQKITKRGKRTLELGAYPLGTHVYEWECPPSFVDLFLDKRRPNDRGNIRVTRIEPRRWGKKVPIQSLRHVDELKKFDPFQHLRLIGDLVHIPDHLPSSTKNMLIAFQTLSKEFGVQEARKRLNQQRNFSRTVEKYLQPIPPGILQKAWKKHIRRFLGAEPLIFPPSIKDSSFLLEAATGIRMKRHQGGTHFQLLNTVSERGNQ